MLVKHAQNRVHFKQYLSPKFLLYKEGESVSYAERLIESIRDAK